MPDNLELQVTIQYVPKDYPAITPAKITQSVPTLFVYDEPFVTEKPNSRFWLRCHKCGLTANLGDHEVKIENDLVTISPSISCPRTLPTCAAHYYIKNSKIIEA